MLLCFNTDFHHLIVKDYIQKVLQSIFLHVVDVAFVGHVMKQGLDQHQIHIFIGKHVTVALDLQVSL